MATYIHIANQMFSQEHTPKQKHIAENTSTPPGIESRTPES